MESLVVGVGGVNFESLVSHIAKHHLGLLLNSVGFYLAIYKKHALVAVAHCNYRHIVVFAALVEAVLVVGDNVTINAWPTVYLIVAYNIVCVYLTHLFDRFLFEYFHCLNALLLGYALCGAGKIAAWSVGVGCKRTTALTYYTVK